MLTEALLISVQVLVAQATPGGDRFPPDQVHILRAADGHPNVELVLDSSGSMAEGVQDPTPYIPESDCTYYWNQVSPCRSDPEPPIGDSTWRDCHPDSYWNAVTSKPHLTKTDQLKAVLTGCRTASDGILDKWSGRINFALRQFGEDRTGLLLPGGDFGMGPGKLAQLESAVRSLPAEGYTPLTPAHALAARHFHDYFGPSNTEECRQNYIVMLTDGIGNRDYNFQSYDWECSGTEADVSYASTPAVTNENPAEGAAYVYRRASMAPTLAESFADNMCSVDGRQSIGTYTIGFHTDAQGNNVLEDVARAGGGRFYPSTDYESLDQAFEEIIVDILERASVNFGGATIANDGAFQGNYVYVAHWAPSQHGKWAGNLKKFRLFPFDTNFELDASDHSTYFVVDPANPASLVINTTPRDVWSGDSSLRARAGGAGAVMLTNRGWPGDPAPPDAVYPAPPAPYERTIKTWRPMEPFADYVPFNGSAAGLSPDETWTPNFCEHMRLINYINGYTYDVNDCAACNAWGDAGCAPVGLDWPLASAIDGSTTLLKYHDNCEGGSGRCFVVTGGQAGLISFFDAYDGHEVSALLPGELLSLKPGASPIANDYLRDIDHQPSFDAPLRFYADGAIRLLHDDRNGNGVIDAPDGSPESAYLVFGLGRGGREMVLVPVGPGFDGEPTVAAGNPARILAPFNEPKGSSFSNIQDMWSAPAYSELRDPVSGDFVQVIAFGSGHMRHLDYPNAQMGAGLPVSGSPGALTNVTVPAGGYANGCAALMAQNGETALACDPLAYLSDTLPPPPAIPRPLYPCTPCNDPLGCAGGAPFCYDWPGVASIAPAYAPPHNIVTAPLRWHNGAGGRAVGFQVVFSTIDLQPGDCINLKDGSGATVESLCGALGGPVTSHWIYDDQFSLQFSSNGIDDVSAYGYTIADINVLVQGPALGVCAACDVDNDGACSASATECAPAGPIDCGACDLDGDFACSPAECGTATSTTTTPSVYVMDLHAWAADNDPEGYRDALMMRFTSACGSQKEANEVCFDASDAPDLQHMIFPISSEIAKFEEGGVLRALYFGDEGGQIWKLFFDPLANNWSARRLAIVNRSVAGIQGNSKDFRKIFTKLEVVRSSCNGTRSVGVYFGTGNLQRAASFDNLGDPNISGLVGGNVLSNRNIMGVVWDSPKLPAGGTDLEHMLNVTDEVRIADPTQDGTQGYFIELLANEKVLRPALVFNGVAFFKTYQPVTPATECVSSRGVDRVYAFNNCNAEPVTDSNGNAVTDTGDRLAWSSDVTDIGAPLMLFTPKGEDAFVQTGDQVAGNAALPSKRFRKGLSLLLFRLI
ncbi:MAG: hypothetical protein H6729_00240 [Deltaproteobacteria bacterium]|nr:hypothetical protein [Deltaproteobacteria bacterium]